MAELARAMGVALSAAEAAQLAVDLGGWPGLIRVALLTAARTARGGLLLDDAGLADYLRLILQDAQLADVMPELLALAVPAELTPDVVDRLLGASADEAVLRARSGGLLPEGDGRPAYPARLRSLLLRILREDAPARFRELNRTLAEHHSRAAEPLAALRHASTAQEPAMVMSVVERWWTELLEHPEAVREALARVPPELLDASAKARVARDHILRHSAPQGFVAPVPAPGWPDLGARTAGSPASAADGEETAVLLGLGTARLVAGDPLGAARAFTEARSAFGGAPVVDGAAAEAAGGLALSLALLGHPEPARLHLPVDAPDGLGAAAAVLVPVLLDLDRLGSGPALATGAGARLTGRLVALEAVGTYVRAGLALHAGRGAAAIGEVTRLRQSPAGSTGLAKALLTATLVDLYLASDQIDHARRLVAAESAEGPWARATHARVALVRGDFDGVLDLTDDAVEQASLHPRAALDQALARTVAANRLGRYRVASEALDLAVAVVQTSGIVRRLLLVPRPDLEQVARTVPQAAELLARPELAVAAQVPMPDLTRQLSRSERRVLGELASGRRISQVARRLYVSESTVKTQVRSVYRKLEVHSRGDALARARALGILPAEQDPGTSEPGHG
ncbi:LuxR C-terminal-related transcriptional regulator [Georgenia sp.]